MGILPLLLFAALALSGTGVALFFWAVRSGQLDDLEGAASLALRDRPPRPGPGEVRPPEGGDP
ncbi:cbb3-type cytochrome oxidase assembly protein CcoS [Myxococcota bacterium]|nr:cbb3-type cytochrome oxidase assembly protein CcoS [Myxococcota bacterium]